MKMKCLKPTSSGLVVVALMTSLGFAAAACRPTYNITKYRLDFEDISVPCFFNGPCMPMTRFNVSTSRGQGLAYLKYGAMERPLLIPNLGAWQAINCTWEGFAGMDERFACANNSVRALYSPGKSPYDGSKPRINTLDFPETYGLGALDSVYFTPIGLPKNSYIKEATVELVGIKLDGKKVKHDIKLDIASGKKQFLLSKLKDVGFTNLKVLELWLVANGKGGYAFAIDDMNLEEYRPLPLPASCTPTPTIVVDHGPCTPPPTKATTWTANAEEFTTSTSVPGPLPYKSLTWNSYTNVQNVSTFTSYFWPANITTRGNFYQSYSPFQLTAYSREQQFGVQSLSLICGFAQWADPDFTGTNGTPCTITFVGRRDPYDGDGLPSIVIANYTIPNPGRDATTQRFTTINLNSLTKSPGKFNSLYSFSIYARLGANFVYETQLLLDNVVFTRTTSKYDRKCRMPGGQELNFDDIEVGSTVQKMPVIYKDFKFSEGWGVNSKKNYAPGTPGYLGVLSPSNEIWSGMEPANQYGLQMIDSYINPASNFLFDFEEVTITLDLPEALKNLTMLQDVQISINVQDACGSGSPYFNAPSFLRPQYWSYRTVVPEKLTFTFAEPIRAISSFSVYAYLITQDFRQIEVFMDNFRYRRYKGPIPGCQQCGSRGGDRCEVPVILPR